jgi:hypothetical protein
MRCDPDNLREHKRSDIAVSMHDDLVVVRLPQRLDRASTATLVSLVDAATSCHPSVVIDLDDTESITSFACPTGDVSNSTGAASGGPWVTGEGCVRLRSASVYWTFDLNGRRLLRSDTPVDCRFVEPHDWVSIRGLWTTRSSTTVLTEHETFLSTQTGWTTRRDTTAAVPRRGVGLDSPPPRRRRAA